MTAERDKGHPAASPPDGTDWRQWTEGIDWSDWRTWLQRFGSAGWAAAPWSGAPREQAPATGHIPLTLRAEGVARYYWPGQTWEHSLDRLGPDRIEVAPGAA